MDKKTNKKMGLLALLALTGLAVCLLASCEDSLDVQQSYPFTVETMPVPTRIVKGETVEIRCELKHEGRFKDARYTVVTNSVKMIHKERSKIDPPFYKTGGSFDNQGDFCGYFSFVSTRKIYKSNST